MGKRFTDTEKWSDPWYRNLPVAYKNFWDYLCARCDNAGVWKVDMDLAQFQVDRTIMATEALKLFEGRVTVLTPGSWNILGFVRFQYGELTPNNNYHRAVLNRLSLIASRSSAMTSSSISAPGQPLPCPSAGAQDKDKDNVGVKDVDVGGSGGFSFDAIWSRYPRKLGRKLAERHFKASVKTPQDFADIQNALDCFIREMRKEGRPDDKIPYGVTWMNNWRDWVNYGGVQMPKPPAPKPRPPDPPDEPLTEAELLAMHKQTLAVLKRCPTPDCELCAKIRKLEEVAS